MIRQQFLNLLIVCSLMHNPSILTINNESIDTLNQDYSSLSNNHEFGDILFDEKDDYDFMNEYLDTAATDRMINAIDPKEIMTIINLINYPQIVQIPLYLCTNIRNQRNLLDQPLFEPDRPVFPRNTTLGIHAFVRKTSRSNFTKNSTRFDSFLALSDRQLLSSLQNSVDRINELFPIGDLNISRIFNLFANMTVDERQAGFMIHFMKQWNRTTLRVMTPLYYVENNFSLTKREQDAIANELGAQDPEEEKAFRKAHFICDKIGMGDTRIEIDQRILKRPSFSLRCGAQATIPTAFVWGTGFLGSSFAKPSTYPVFNLEPIFDSFENPTPENQQAAETSLADFSLDIFDRIAADLIDVKLGNNRHLGLGAYIRGKTPLRAYMNNSLAEKVKLTNRVSVEIFCPSMEKRFYINKINEQAFNSRNFDDLTQANENLTFLEEQTIERLFLRAFTTKITPGAIFRWTSAAYYTGQCYDFSLGTDFWIQDKNSFGSIYASQKTVSNLDVTKAKPPFAEQTKIFGRIIYKHKTAKNWCFISLSADATVSNKGLGQDYGASLNFEASF